MNEPRPAGPPHEAVGSNGHQHRMGRAAVLGVLASLANLIASVVRSKVAAVVLGPIGVGISAEALQWATLSNVPASSFTGPALTQSLVQAIPAGPERAARVTSAALTWSIASSLLLGLLAVLFAPVVLPASAGDVGPMLVGLAALALTATAVQSGIAATLIAHEHLRSVTWSQVSAAIITAASIATFTWLFGLKGQFVGLALGALLALPIFFRGTRQLSAGRYSLAPLFDPEFMRVAMKTGVATLTAGLLLQGALLAVRWTLDAHGGAAWNGQFQAAWAIGSLYIGMLLNGLASFIHPRYARAPDAASLKREVDEAVRFVGRAAPPVILGVICLREVGLRVLYSHAFDLAGSILAWQLVGDTLRCMAWAYAGPLLLRGRRRAFAFTEGTAAVLLATTTLILVPRLGAVGAGIAYCVTYVVYAPVAALALQRSCGVQIEWRWLGVGLALTLAFAAFVALLDDSIVARGIGVAVSLLWFWLGPGRELLSTVMRARRPSPPSPAKQ